MTQQHLGPYGPRVAQRLFKECVKKRVPVTLKKKGQQYWLTVIQPVVQIRK